LQWVQWLRHVVLADREVVMINLDETSIERVIPHRRGHVLAQGSGQPQWYERIPRRDSHGHSTLVACVADDAALQRHLPQFVLTKDAALSRAEREKLAGLPAPLVWHPGTAGWVTSENMPPLLTALRRAIRRQRPNAEIILSMDCASQHISEHVLRHLSILGVHVVLIPAGLTWLLQPLDTHAFATLKRKLAARQAAERAAAADGSVATCGWIDALRDVVWEVLVAGSWAHCFAANGLSDTTMALRPRISGLINAALPLPLAPPVEGQLQEAAGGRRLGLADMALRASVRLLHRPLALPAPPAVLALPGPGAAAAVAAVAEAKRGGAPRPRRPWSPRRTRSGRVYFP
jgi:hypothetical protein